MDTKDTSPDPAPAPVQAARKWPRRVAIGFVLTGVLAGGALWYLGRETTLQMIAQRLAKASGGKLTLTGVSGSLYGAMHIDRIVWRTDEQLVIANKIDLRWSPRQIVSSGVLVDSLHAASLRMETLKESEERTPMPASLAPPFPIAINDARLAPAETIAAIIERRKGSDFRLAVDTVSTPKAAKLPRDLAGLPMVYEGDALLPHPGMAKWVEARVRDARSVASK